MRDLTQTVFFLVSLAAARGVRVLRPVSSVVSFSSADIYLSCLPKSRAKTESSGNPPRSFAFTPCRILSAIFRRNFCCVLFVLCVFIFIILLLFLCVLVLLLGLFLRTLLVSFFAISSLMRLPLPLLLLLGVPRLLLLLPIWPFGRIARGVLRLRGLFLVLFLSLLSLRPLLGGLLLSSLLSTLQMSSSHFPVVLVSGQLWLLARYFRYVFSRAVLLYNAIFQFLSAILRVSLLFVLGSLLFQLRVRAFGGGLLTLHRLSALSLSLRRRSSIVWLLMPCVLLVRQIPYRAMTLGLKVALLRWSRLARCCLCHVAWARRDLQLVHTRL